MLIKLSNFMGKNEEYELSSFNVVTGPNGSGKTTLKNALEYVFTGSIGELATPSAIFLKYASDLEMTVVVEINGITITRGIVQTYSPDGYKYSSVANVVENKRTVASGVKKVDEYLQGKFLPLVFTYDGFLREKSTKRRELIVGLIGYEEPDFSVIADALKSNEIGESIVNFITDKSLDEAIEYAISERTYYNKEQKKYKGATASINEMKSSIAGNLKTLNKIDSDLSAAMEEKATLKQKRFETEMIIGNMMSDKEAVAALQEELEEVKKTSYVDRINQNIKAIEEKKSEITQVAEFQKQDELNELECLSTAYDDKYIDITNQIAKAITQESTLRGKLEYLTQKQSDISSFKGICPAFGIKCTTDVSESVTDISKDVIEVQNRITELGIDKLRVKRADVTEQKKEIDAKLVALRTEKAQIEKEMHVIGISNINITSIISKLTNEIDVMKSKEESKAEKIESIEKAIKALDKKYPAFDPLDEIETMLIATESRIEELKFSKQSLDEKQNLLNASITAAESAKENEELYKEWDKSIDILNKLKIELMSKRLVPIKESVDLILKDMGINAELFFDLVDENGKDQLNFGWVRDGVKVTNLSQGEHLLTSIGILAALQSHTHVPFKMLLLDEILILDSVNAEKLMKSEAITELFDFILLLTPYQLETELYTVTQL